MELQWADELFSSEIEFLEECSVFICCRGCTLAYLQVKCTPRGENLFQKVDVPSPDAARLHIIICPIFSGFPPPPILKSVMQRTVSMQSVVFLRQLIITSYCWGESTGPIQGDRITSTGMINVPTV